jgi:hypothetical protein
MNILIITAAMIVLWVALAFLAARFCRFSGPDNDENRVEASNAIMDGPRLVAVDTNDEKRHTINNIGEK